MIIYKATCINNGKVYIGQTRNSLSHRQYQHYQDSRNPEIVTKFINGIRKHGSDKFTWEIIDRAETKEKLDDKEVYWIAKYNSIENGYNTLEGGSCNPMDSKEVYEKHSQTVKSDEFRQNHSIIMRKIVEENGFSEEHRRKIGEKLKGNQHFLGKEHSSNWGIKRSESASGANHPMYGRRHSEEARRKISEQSKNQKMGARKILQYSIEGEFIQEFPSLASAERWVRDNTEYIKATEQTIRNRARKEEPVYGYAWKYANQ